MSDFWHIWAVLKLFPVSVKQSYDKASADKTFQVDMSHTDAVLPQESKDKRRVRVLSYFEACKLREL